MSSKSESLRLLVVDDEQLGAEAITDLLKAQGVVTRMHLLDDREELEKSLRQPWDLLLFGNAYDLSYQDAMSMVRGAGKDLPVIVMPAADANRAPLSERDQTPQVVAEALAAGVTDVIERHSQQHLVTSIRRELRNLNYRRSKRDLEGMLAEAERRAQLLLKNSRSAVAYIHDGVHIYANDTYLQLFGHDTVDELMGMPVIDLVHSEDIKSFKEFLRTYSKGNHDQSEFSFRGMRVDHSSFDAMLQLAPASYEGEPCIQIIIQRQGEFNAELEAQLAAVERTDPLTGIGNRVAFEEALLEARSNAVKKGTQYALLFISVDNIGQINASTGLSGSDAAMVAITGLLSQQFGDSSLSRFGDASFTVIVPAVSSDAVLQRSQQLVESVAALLIDVDKRTVQTTVSIGIAMIGETSPEGQELLERAFDAADKVKLKNKGIGNGINLYSPAENATQSDSALRELLEEAIEQNKFRLMFQPLYDTEDENALFYEVFLRLPLADGKLMAPDEFMPVAQRFKMDGRLDRWVLLNACKRLKAHLIKHPNTRLLLNLTAESLQDPSLPDLLGKLSRAIGGGHNPLVLQFNESDVINYLKVASENVARFRDAGCAVSISNFGTALNALNTLTHVNANIIKLDKSYVKDLSQDENFAAAKRLTADITALEREVIVAYIENPAAMSKAWSMGARYLQGYYLSQPNEEMVVNNEDA
jgi:diguanylate cyclase (GGDEF)-like protein/PAS domain S-box-containing protein